MELLLPTGPFVENAKITPEMCASGLGYALPMLANVASAEGQLSIKLDGGRIPLSDPKQGELRGTLTMHHAKVGPGPLVTQLSSMLRIPPAYSVVRENAVKIWFEKGRVNHENLVLVFPDNFTVTTSGSVGVDGTLSLVAEMPFPTKLLGNFKLPAGVAQQPIKVPIGGTVKSPQIDPRAFQQILAQGGTGAIGNIGNIIGGGNNPLGGLFGPKKQ